MLVGRDVVGHSVGLARRQENKTERKKIKQDAKTKRKEVKQKAKTERKEKKGFSYFNSFLIVLLMVGMFIIGYKTKR